MDGLGKLYAFRFPPGTQARREAIWRVLCKHFLQRYVLETDTVLDIACGSGEFIRNIRAGRRIGVDINPENAPRVGDGIEFHPIDATDLAPIEAASIDVCFSSNFFEHLPSKDALDRVLNESYRVLKPGGRFVSMHPNLRYAPGEFWDYYDHLLPLTDRSCAEAFAKAGFDLVDVIDRFMPFSTRSRLPQSPWLVRFYLSCRPAWRVIGRQFLIVAKKPN